MKHLIEGLGETGLGELFKSLGVLAWALAIAGGIGILIPAAVESPVATGLTDVMSHKGADLLLEAAAIAGKFLKFVH